MLYKGLQVQRVILPSNDSNGCNYKPTHQLLREKERVKKKNKGDKLDKYLGLLYPTEDYKVYGYITNTNVKMIIVTTENANPKDPDLRMFFTNFHKLYVNAASNPFYESNTKIDSPSFVKALTTLATKGII